MRQRGRWIYFLFFILSACGSEKIDPKRDTRTKGTINISADESFKPVIDAQVQVYEADYPDVKLNVSYKAEADCLKDLTVDSVRMVIVTRRINKEEREFLVDSLKVSPDQMMMAYDAIAVIIHPDVEIRRFTLKDIREILQGKFRENLIPVFDGLKATSTVRFIVDSVLRGDSLTSKALAARSSEEVVEYVSTNPGAIGFIGVSWIGNKDDPQQQSFLTKVRLAEMECKGLAGQYVQPIQANIYNGLYPFIRELVFILKENHRDGLGHGFSNFMTSERGQLIFRRAYLVPAHLPFIVRPVKVRE
ncbi:MAG TPA: substrate-binding domain-containing protein [Chitinophagaceae bacterium]|nr:substrate-binding domain-containing protein [Chitinophagaceae bacterium]